MPSRRLLPTAVHEERKVVSVLFCDIVGHEDDAERAVRSGLRIIESLAELNEADPTLGLHVRVGINTGEALVTLGDSPFVGRVAERALLTSLADAVIALDALGRHNERARALLGHGRALMHLGRPGVEGSLREAHRLFTSFGLRPRVAEANALLQASEALAG